MSKECVPKPLLYKKWILGDKDFAIEGLVKCHANCLFHTVEEDLKIIINLSPAFLSKCLRGSTSNKKMSAYERVKQWNTFARVWHIFDAKWQNPFDSAKVISKRLQGQHKPIYHPLNDCGDHVIVFNSRHIALPGYEWKRRAYFHHTGYPGGASWTLAWQLHEINPTLVMQKAVKWEIPRTLVKFRLMARLHIFPDEDVPEELLKNVSSQIRQLRSIPRNLNSYSEQEINEFPKVLDFPKNYVLK